jgi:hypothetical protein
MRQPNAYVLAVYGFNPRTQKHERHGGPYASEGEARKAYQALLGGSFKVDQAMIHPPTGSSQQLIVLKRLGS